MCIWLMSNGCLVRQLLESNKFTIIHVHILLASQLSCIISDELTGEEGSYDASEERGTNDEGPSET